MFRTNSRWEHRAAFSQRDSVANRQATYVMVEFPTEKPIFHVELLMTSSQDGEVRWKRYLVVSLAIVLEILGDSRVVDSRVAIQTFSELLDKYKIHGIDAILSFEDADGLTNLVYRHEDGSEHFDGAGVVDSGAQAGMSLLWKSAR